MLGTGFAPASNRAIALDVRLRPSRSSKTRIATLPDRRKAIRQACRKDTINLAYMIGATRIDQFQDLHTIRKMRNKCAHSFGAVSLSEDPLRSHVNALQQIQVYPTFRDEYPPECYEFLDNLDDSPRYLLFKHFAHLAYGLYFRRVATARIESDSLADMTAMWRDRHKQDAGQGDQPEAEA